MIINFAIILFRLGRVGPLTIELWVTRNDLNKTNKIGQKLENVQNCFEIFELIILQAYKHGLTNRLMRHESCQNFQKIRKKELVKRVSKANEFIKMHILPY